MEGRHVLYGGLQTRWKHFDARVLGLVHCVLNIRIRACRYTTHGTVVRIVIDKSLYLSLEDDIRTMAQDQFHRRK